uniref:Reverse transcriptase domain-containing protein n=1 Tax=Lepeophtheirus salmonis TaxID=72036 RepID=A0A0K2VDF9_LEPSM
MPFTIQTLLESEKNVSLMAIYFAKALDTLSHKYIIQSLYRKGFADYIIRMVGVILSRTRTWFQYGPQKCLFYNKRGVKQNIHQNRKKNIGFNFSTSILKCLCDADFNFYWYFTSNFNID